MEDDRAYTCYCNVIEDPNPEKVIVEFNYLSDQWLVARDLKKRQRTEEDDDDDVQFDGKRTLRSVRLARRRAAKRAEPAATRASSVEMRSVYVSSRLVCNAIQIP